MNPLPRITIVTPSFNQAPFIEQTITSVLDQGYQDLEYFVVDGGSTDGSVDIIRKYAKHLTWWVSEKDRGQTHAINKGLRRATGNILAYLNSDDFYVSGALRRVGEFFQQHPGTDLLHGGCRIVDIDGEPIGTRLGSITRYDEVLDLWDVWWRGRNYVQPEVFWSARVRSRIGLLREDLHWVMDHEYWIRILRAGGKVGRVNHELACFRTQPQQKSSQSAESAREQLAMVRPFIWEPHQDISRQKRINLKGKWIFDAMFRQEAQRSLTLREARWLRWLRLAMVSIRHPEILAAPSFWVRADNSISHIHSSSGD